MKEFGLWYADVNWFLHFWTKN